MKNELIKGESIHHSFLVGNDDLATFQSSNVHQVCSTFALAREIEWCSRKFVLREKEDNEEGIGTKLEIDHVSPAFLNSEVRITAVVENCQNNELLCSFRATVNSRTIAKGFTGQKVLKKTRIKEIFSTFDQP